ncbi:MAG: AAA family ATPase, partial [Bacillota bacterium]
MKINLIHLQNIKSYDDREIRFFDGVNFISGINGAGKSTIIESIGFALFDVKPKPLVNFLRDGAKSGAVTVFFTANDDREYRVVRKLRGNAAFSWQVYDAETGGELDLHGAGDVRAWLAENTGIDPDQDPEKLFRDVIGVNQGNFTAPFLQSEVPRKQVFNSILKVDGYREAYQKSANAVTILRDAIREKEKER